MKRLSISMLVVSLLVTFCNIVESAGLSQVTDVLSIQKELVNPDSEDTTAPKINYVAELNKIGIAGRPESDNAAPFYQKAIELFVEQPQGLIIQSREWPKDYPARQHAMLKKWVQDNSSALQQLQLASQKSYYWYKHTGQKLHSTEKKTETISDVPNLSTIRNLAKALQNRAMLSAEEGNMTSALNDIETLYTIGAQMSAGPKILVEKLVGTAIKNLSVGVVNKMLDRKMLDNNSMKSIEDRFKEIVTSYREPLDFRGEKIYLQEQVNTDPKYVGLKPFLKNTLERYDKMAAKTPMQIHNEPAEPANENDPSQALAPPFGRIVELEYRSRADEDALITTLAIHRYNSATDSYPGTLQQLVSGGYIKEVPMDPFSGNPLVYKRTIQGFTLYSFGTDYDDDDGQRIKRGSDDKSGDRVFWPIEQTQTAQQPGRQRGPYARTEPQAGQRNQRNNQTSDMSLTEAVAMGDTNQVQALLSQGADINQKNRMGWTPLHTAIQKQNKELAEIILAKNPDLNLTDKRGQTPLHMAVNSGQKEMVQLLIAKGANVNAMTGSDNALTLARKRRYTEIADIITQNGGREPTQEELMGERYYMDYANAPTANQQPSSTYRGRTGFRAQAQPDEVDILADPNEIKARINTFPGLQKILDDVDANSQNEMRQWQQTRYDNRTMLIRSVQKQFEDEINVIRTTSVSEKAEKTTKAIDVALTLRKERFKLISRELMTQRREQRESQQTTRSRGRGRGRTSGRGSSRYGSQGGQSDSYDSGGYGGYGRSSAQSPYGGRGDTMGRSGRYARPTRPPTTQQQAAEMVDRAAQDESRQWMQASFEDKSDLATAVNDQIQLEVTALRVFAVEENAKKTTAAIDGILLARQVRLDDYLQKMEQLQLTQRQGQDPRMGMSGRYQQDSRYSPRGGSSSGGYQQGNQRTRRRR